uniref:Mos1 transposase HTH domain-containing protein n=1 Tax=Acrobeloides nanus TaxID=290746 RepID=A0A914E6J2_9BILA
MLYHYEKGWTAAQSFRDLNELYGERTISERQCREWFASFKTGDTSLEGKPGRLPCQSLAKELNRDFFARGIDRLPSKWEAVIEVDGEYAPE